LNISPSSLTLAPGETGEATLTVELPADALGCTRDNIIVRAIGTGVENSATCVAHLAAVRGVGVSISPRRQVGRPGEVLSYEVTVTNLGNVEDEFSLLASDNEGWPLQLSSSRLSLSPGGRGSVALTVVLPENVLEYLEDNITVEATSLLDPAISASDSCAAHPLLRRASVSISPSEQSAPPGSSVEYSVAVKNLGELEDNISLEACDELGWGLELADAWLAIPPGGEATTTLRVTIPAGTAAGVEDRVTVSAAPLGHPAGGGSASCLARAAAVFGVEVSISPSYQSGLPGSTLMYTVSVANKGNVADNFSLAATDELGWTLSLSTTMLEVPAGENRSATLTVGLPADAPGCTSDEITVRAVGSEVENSAVCVAHVAIVGGIEVTISPAHQSGLPGAILEYVASVLNTGNAGDNFSLAVSDELGWELELSSSTMELPAGGSGQAMLRVFIPLDASPCTRNEVTVVVRGTWAENSASCIAGVGPLPPRPLEPPDGSMVGESRPTFRWENVHVADGYELWVDDDPDFSSPEMIENVVENSFTPSIELAEGRHWWRVRAYRCGLASEFSEAWTFVVDVTPPSSRVDAIFPYWRNSSPLSLTASASDALSGVASVELWFRYSPDNSSWSGWSLFGGDDSPPWSWSFDFPRGEGYYEFYTVARDAAGNVEAPPPGADASCGLDVTPPTRPSPTSPIDGSPTNDNTPTLSWTAAGDALSGMILYELWVDDDPNFGSPEVVASTSSTSYGVAVELREGAQYWRVRAVDGAGNASGWAGAWFIVDVTPPAEPTLASPPDGKLDNRRGQVFAWTRPEPGLAYHIQIDDEPSFSPPLVHENQAVGENFYTHTFAADGRYYWRVRARDAAGNLSGWSIAFRLTIDTQPPAKPTLLSPENNAVRNTLSTTFTWTRPEPDVTYHIQIDDEPSLSPPFVHENQAVGENLYSLELSSEGTYHWRVRARDAAGNWGEWSDNFKFTVQLPPGLPGRPALLSPSNGVLTNDNMPVFRWVPGENAEAHRLLIDDAPDFSSPVDDLALGAATHSWAKPPPGYADGTYYWKVVAINAAGENSSEVWTFTVDATPPAAPTLLRPADGENINDASPRLEWGAVSDASPPVLYRVVVSDSPTFAHENRSSGWISPHDWRVSPALSEGLWYWRVQARDNAGNLGGWSAARSFRVDLTPPGAPTLLEPIDGAAISEERPRFRWAAVYDESLPVVYRLQVDNNPDFSSPEVDVSGLADNVFSPAVPLPVDNYRWRVRAVDNAGNVGDWSAAWTLRIVEAWVAAAPAPAAVRGVSVAISPSSASATPGRAISYTVAVRNTGEVEDSYSLAAVDTLGWSPALSQGRLEAVRPGEERKATLSVLVPDGATVGAEDRITVVARGTNVSASATCVASAAEAAPRAGVSVEILPATKSGPPGAKLTFRVLVRNAGEADDAFSLVVSGAPEWSPRLQPTRLELAAGAVGSAELELEVPRRAEEGSSETFSVTATSSLDPSVAASASCTAVVGAAPLVLLIPIAAAAMLIGAVILLVSYLRHRAKKARRSRVLSTVGGP
jgi:uncharacterized membrane protein